MNNIAVPVHRDLFAGSFGKRIPALPVRVQLHI